MALLLENGDRIVFAGDSVTDMGRARPIGEGLGDSLGHGYPRMVENLLVAWYPERRIRVTNVGTGGNTSRDLLARFEREVPVHQTDWLSICIGINDVWRQFDSPCIPECACMPEEYAQNLEQMITMARDKVKGIFLLTPYYIEPNPTDRMRRRMDEYGAIMKRLAEKHGCILVDFQQMFSDFLSDNDLHSALIAWDRVHPNELGATLMAREFLRRCGADFCR